MTVCCWTPHASAPVGRCPWSPGPVHGGSCIFPATRDAGTLVHELGFNLCSAGVMDMFPHTSHVESVAVFGR